jgi:hypothetical protein
MTRIVIADRFDIVRLGLRQNVAEAADGRETLRQANRKKPDLLITAYSVPLINEVNQKLRKKLDATRCGLLGAARRGSKMPVVSSFFRTFNFD